MSRDTRETLTDLLRLAAQRHDASGRQLGEMAQSRGLEITHTTINHILNGRYRSRPGEKTLQAIAELANVPLERVHAAAGRPITGRRLADELPRDADLLTPRQRTAVIEIIRAMVDPGVRAGEEEFMQALGERLAEDSGMHSPDERLAALEKAMEIAQRSRSLDPAAKALIAELAVLIRDHMQHHEAG